MRGADLPRGSGRLGDAPLPRLRDEFAARKWRGCFGAMRSDVTAACRWLVQCTSQPEANARASEKDGSDPISTRRHCAGRLDGTGKM